MQSDIEFEVQTGNGHEVVKNRHIENEGHDIISYLDEAYAKRISECPSERRVSINKSTDMLKSKGEIEFLTLVKSLQKRWTMSFRMIRQAIDVVTLKVRTDHGRLWTRAFYAHLADDYPFLE